MDRFFFNKIRFLRRDNFPLGILGILLVALLSITTPVSGASAQTESMARFVEANQRFQSGNYPEAIRLYEELLQTGYGGGTLYYNLGNAYLKTGAKGLAVLSYERAGRWLPRDADIRNNMALALQGVHEGTPDWGWQLLDMYHRIATVNEYAGLASLCLACFLLCLIAPLIFKDLFRDSLTGRIKKGWRHFVIGTGLLLILIWAMAVIVYADQMKPYAVIVNPGTEVRYEPVSSSARSFALEEGTRTLIIQTKNGWALVKRRDGKVGWIDATAFRKI